MLNSRSMPQALVFCLLLHAAGISITQCAMLFGMRFVDRTFIEVPSCFVASHRLGEPSRACATPQRRKSTSTMPTQQPEGSREPSYSVPVPCVCRCRHGESQWNLENRFTGWYNIQLSPKGEQEAAEGGRLIHEAGYKFGESVNTGRFLPSRLCWCWRTSDACSLRAACGGALGVSRSPCSCLYRCRRLVAASCFYT